MVEDRWDPSFDRGRLHFAPILAATAPFRALSAWPLPEAWNAYLPTDPPLRTAGGAPLRFELQAPRPVRRRRRGPVDLSTVYDERIYVHGCVPSRARNWHDFFNMLVWLSFPTAKCAVNARQRAALHEHVAPGARRLPGARSRGQDALAMLDEGGLLLLCESGAVAPVTCAIRSGDLTGLAAAVAQGTASALIFGHALYEHLVLSEAPVRACGVVLTAPGPLPRDAHATRAAADTALAALLADRECFAAPDGAPAVPLVDLLFA